MPRIGLTASQCLFNNAANPSYVCMPELCPEGHQLVDTLAGTFWGELGFFKLEKGINTLQIESGDCWYAVPEYEVEMQVREGDLVGSMYGLIPKNHSAPQVSIA